MGNSVNRNIQESPKVRICKVVPPQLYENAAPPNQSIEHLDKNPILFAAEGSIMLYLTFVRIKPMKIVMLSHFLGVKIH